MRRNLAGALVQVLFFAQLLGGCDGDPAMTVDAGPRVDGGVATCGLAATGNVAYTGAFPTTSGESDSTLTVSGLAREVFVYVPTSRGASPPLLIALHGTGSGTDEFPGRYFGANFEAMAEANGVVVVAPDSQRQASADWDQHAGGEQYWETRPDVDPSRGCDPNRNPDLLLVRAVIEEATRAYGVDPARIYVAGFSNGGFFSITVSVALREQIAAFAVLSGGLVECENTNSCSFAGTSTTCAGLMAEDGYCACGGDEHPIALPTSGRMPPAFISHGNQDYVVTVSYACQLAARMTALGHTAVVDIRDGAAHEVADFTDPAVYGPLWTFFDQHRLR